MAKHAAWRILLIVPTTLLASIVIFGIMRALPGDVAIVILSGGGESPHSVEARERLREELGLDDPLPVQYGRWLHSMATGDFGGRSLVNKEPIGALAARQLPVTLLLVSYAAVLSVAVSIPLGVFAAFRRDRWPDYLVRFLALPGQALPHIWIALLIILGLLLVFRWSPPIVYSHPWENPKEHLQLLVWPVLVLAWESSAHIVRVTRASLLDVLGQEYIVVARGKGLPERIVLLRHALRNAFPPIATVVGLQVGILIGGTLVLESIFGLPGLGRGLVQAALARDYPVVQTFATLLVFFMLLVNVVVDLAATIADPRTARGAS